MRYKEYLDDVCSQVRFKAAHKTLRQELTVHIDDKKTALEEANIPDAQTQAIAAMGDAAETGSALNAIHKPRTEWGVIIGVLLLSLAGLLFAMLLGASDPYFSTVDAVYHQVIGIAVGVILMLGIIFLDYTQLLRFRVLFYVLGAGICIACSLLLNGYYGSSQVPNLLIVLIQYVYPLAEYITPVLFSLSIIGFIESSQGKGISGLLKIGALCAFTLVLALKIPAGYIVFNLFIVFLILISVSIHRGYFSTDRRWWLYLILFTGIAIVPSIIIFGFGFDSGIFSRFLSRLSIGSHFNPEAEGYMVAQAREMLSSAKLIGPSDFYIANQTKMLPYSSTNYMFTSIVGAYGWVAGIGITLVFITMFTLMVLRSRKIQLRFGKMLASGVSIYLLTNFIISILINLGLFGGLVSSMPFLSTGGFYYVENALLIGIFLSVWRRSSFLTKDTEIEKRPIRFNRKTNRL